MTQFYDVQSLVKKNPKILNSRPHHWQTISRFAVELDARSYLEELRDATKHFSLPYRYRLKAIEVSYE